MLLCVHKDWEPRTATSTFTRLLSSVRPLYRSLFKLHEQHGYNVSFKQLTCTKKWPEVHAVLEKKNHFPQPIKIHKQVPCFACSFGYTCSVSRNQLKCTNKCPVLHEVLNVCTCSDARKDTCFVSGQQTTG